MSAGIAMYPCNQGFPDGLPRSLHHYVFADGGSCCKFCGKVGEPKSEAQA